MDSSYILQHVSSVSRHSAMHCAQRHTAQRFFFPFFCFIFRLHFPQPKCSSIDCWCAPGATSPRSFFFSDIHYRGVHPLSLGHAMQPNQGEGVRRTMVPVSACVCKGKPLRLLSRSWDMWACRTVSKPRHFSTNTYGTCTMVEHQGLRRPRIRGKTTF